MEISEEQRLVGLKGFLNPRISIFFETKVFLFVYPCIIFFWFDFSKPNPLPLDPSLRVHMSGHVKCQTFTGVAGKFIHLHIEGLIYPIILSEILGSKDNSQSTKIS